MPKPGRPPKGSRAYHRARKRMMMARQGQSQGQQYYDQDPEGQNYWDEDDDGSGNQNGGQGFNLYSGLGRAAPAPVIGLRTMVPPAPGPTIYDPRQEMIPASVMDPPDKFSASPFGPGATIFDPRPRQMQGWGELEIAEDMGGFGFMHGAEKPSLIKMGLLVAVGAVAGHSYGKSKKQKQHSALIGAGIGAIASYLF